MMHDIMRSLKKQPFLMLESCPSATNWQSVSKLKRPGMLEAEGLQAIAHGSDSVMYFQIRKARGSSEKFHGSVIDHYGGEDDRVYQDCCRMGGTLLSLGEIAGADTHSDAAVIYDWENKWAMEDAQGPRNQGLFYLETVQKSYKAFRRQGLNVDVIDMTQTLDDYRIVAAPMLYMFRAGFQEKAKTFVQNGGTLILTYWSGVVDENDLCFLGGTPSGLMDVAGLRSTEIDGLYDQDKNTLCPVSEEPDGRKYECRHLCQLVKTTTAKPLYVYGEDFYAGTPAATVNSFGEGSCYYICADEEQAFYDDLYRSICQEAGVKGPIREDLPEGIEVTTRHTDEAEYIFIQNFNAVPVRFPLQDTGAEDDGHGDQDSEGRDRGAQQPGQAEGDHRHQQVGRGPAGDTCSRPYCATYRYSRRGTSGRNARLSLPRMQLTPGGCRGAAVFGGVWRR